MEYLVVHEILFSGKLSLDTQKQRGQEKLNKNNDIRSLAKDHVV